MRKRIIKNGNTVVFDARDILRDRSDEGMALLEMRNGPISYTTEEGVKFWQKHPYQWVSQQEADVLAEHKNPEFRSATLSDLEEYYSYD